jgi:multicomponent K+:H+ antiporter subunit A
MTLFFAVLTPFAGAALVALASRFGRSHAAWAAGAVTLAALLWLAPSARLPFAGEMQIQQHDWMPALGLNLAFRLDGLALLFAGLILGIGLSDRAVRALLPVGARQHGALLQPI